MVVHACEARLVVMTTYPSGISESVSMGLAGASGRLAFLSSTMIVANSFFFSLAGNPQQREGLT